MVFPQYEAGEILTADKLNDRIDFIVEQHSDQSVTSSTDFVDSQIRFFMNEFERFRYSLYLRYNSDDVPDFKWAFAGQTGTLMTRFTGSYQLTAPTGEETGTTIQLRAVTGSPTATIRAGGTEADQGVFENGIIVNGENAGDIILRFGQNTSDAATTSLLTGSFMEVRRIQ